MHSNPSLPDLMLLLVPAGEDPFGLDVKLPVFRIAHDPSEFLREATQLFGTTLVPEHLKMTVLELADYLNRSRTK